MTITPSIERIVGAERRMRLKKRRGLAPVLTTGGTETVTERIAEGLDLGQNANTAPRGVGPESTAIGTPERVVVNQGIVVTVIGTAVEAAEKNAIAKGKKINPKDSLPLKGVP